MIFDLDLRSIIYMVKVQVIIMTFDKSSDKESFI